MWGLGPSQIKRTVSHGLNEKSDAKEVWYDLESFHPVTKSKAGDVHWRN